MSEWSTETGGGAGAAPLTMSLDLAQLAQHVYQAQSAQCTIGIAISVPEPHGELLRSWRREFGDPAADSIPSHITLLPPTIVEQSTLEQIEEHLAEVAADCSAFTVELKGTETFRPVSQVVFVTLGSGKEECDQLQRKMRTGPLVRDLSFPYHPHVTVAHDIESEALDRAQTTLADFMASFTVDGFTLYDQDGDGGWVARREFSFRAAD